MVSVLGSRDGSRIGTPHESGEWWRPILGSQRALGAHTKPRAAVIVLVVTADTLTWSHLIPEVGYRGEHNEDTPEGTAAFIEDRRVFRGLANRAWRNHDIMVAGIVGHIPVPVDGSFEYWPLTPDKQTFFSDIDAGQFLEVRWPRMPTRWHFETAMKALAHKHHIDSAYSALVAWDIGYHMYQLPSVPSSIGEPWMAFASGDWEWAGGFLPHLRTQIVREDFAKGRWIAEANALLMAHVPELLG